jgi:hypothetical protein
MAPLRRHRTRPRVIRPEQAHAEGMRFIHRIDLAGHGPRCPRGGAARRARDAQAELAHRRVVAGFPRWRRVVHLGRVPGPARPAGQRAVGLRLGRRLRPIPPYEALQRKPERDHDQAEDDDRQHREGQAHHRPRSDQAGCWPGQGPPGAAGPHGRMPSPQHHRWRRWGSPGVVTPDPACFEATRALQRRWSLRT